MQHRGTVISVNISEKKGVIKSPVNNIILNESGIKNDAHAGDWHRQVSLLADESIDRFKDVLGREIEYGEFAENITTKGLVLYNMKPGDILKIGKEVVMEVTQIGKELGFSKQRAHQIYDEYKQTLKTEDTGNSTGY